mmetsp:Transcript_59781/g.185409  ORF Transcript_59781/g.185409 Transcript_59781/m.185409 type:complete len:201 (-) Transcript_59781:643-1245(-)
MLEGNGRAVRAHRRGLHEVQEVVLGQRKVVGEGARSVRLVAGPPCLRRRLLRQEGPVEQHGPADDEDHERRPAVFLVDLHELRTDHGGGCLISPRPLQLDHLCVHGAFGKRSAHVREGAEVVELAARAGGGGAEHGGHVRQVLRVEDGPHVREVDDAQSAVASPRHDRKEDRSCSPVSVEACAEDALADHVRQLLARLLD